MVSAIFSASQKLESGSQKTLRTPLGCEKLKRFVARPQKSFIKYVSEQFLNNVRSTEAQEYCWVMEQMLGLQKWEKWTKGGDDGGGGPFGSI